MKTKNLGAGIFCTIAIAAIFTMNINKNEDPMSDLLLTNIEALAQGESGYTCSVTAYCYGLNGQLNGDVKCTGIKECTSGKGFVVCDGNINTCSYII